MFGGKKQNSRLLASAAAMAIGGLGGLASTYGALTMEIRATAVSGSGVTLVNNNSVTVTTASAGGLISFSVFAHVTGGNGSTDGFQTSTFRLVSTNASGGVVLGSMSNTGTANAIANGLQSPFNASGAALGSTNLDLDTDTDLDIGGTNLNTSTNMAAVRSAVMTIGNDFEVYRFSLPITTVLNNAGGTTTVDLTRRTTTSATSWQEAGVAKSPATSTFSVTPTVITLASAGTSSISLTSAPAFTNVADNTNTSENPGSTVAGAVHVTGSPSAGYASEIDGLTGNSSNASAVVDLAIAAPVYVMLWLNDTNTGNASTVATLVSNLQAGEGAGGYTMILSGQDQWNPLQSLYGGFNALVKFNSGVPANGAFNWNFAANSDIVVDQIALVPEPTGIAAVLLPAVGLIGRRRRKA